MFLGAGVNAQNQEEHIVTILSNEIQKEEPTCVKDKEGAYKGGYYTTLNFNYRTFETVSNVVTKIIRRYSDLILVKAWYKGEDGMLTSMYNIKNTTYYITIIYLNVDGTSYLIIGAVNLAS